MLQSLTAYAIVLLSTFYLVRRAVRKKRGNCCGSRVCPKAPQPLLRVGLSEKQE